MDLRQKVETAGQNALQEALRGALDAIAGRDRVLRIDRLDIDLGQIAPNGDLDLDALATAVAQELARVLETDETPPPEHTVDEEASVTLQWQDAQTLRLEALLFYFREGFLPASAPERDASELGAALFEGGGLPERGVSQVAEALGSSPTVALRFLHVLHISDVLLFLEAYAQSRSGDKQTEVQDLGAALQAAAASRQALDLNLWARRLQDVVLPQGRGSLVDTGSIGAQGSDVEVKALHPFQQDAANDMDSAMQPEAAALLPLRDAGLVLIGPFLPRLFERLGLDQSGQDAATAAQLLFWLAHGHEDHLEPDLLIARVLLAIPPEVPLINEAGLSTEVTTEATSLLDAVIGHWPQLGKTSHDGLRETFLQRPGLLERRAKGPRIAVESSGVDVLLGGIGWSYSPLRLPWCAQPIDVDWA